MKKIFIVFASLFLCNTLFSQEYVTLKQGEKAPFDGFLLTKDALSKIMADKEYIKKEVGLEKDLQCNKEKIVLEQERDNFKIEKETLFKQKELVETMNKQRIEELNKIIEKSSKDYSTLWMAGGAGGGILLTLTVMYLTLKTDEIVH